MIYETVPDNPEIRLDQRISVKEHLEANKGKLFTAHQIALATGLPTKGTQVEVRKAITLLIEEEGIPIIAGSQGFTWATSPDQLLHYADQLEARMKGIQRRIDAVRLAYLNNTL